MLQYALNFQGIRLKASVDTGCTTMVFISSQTASYSRMVFISVYHIYITGMQSLQQPFKVQVADTNASTEQETKCIDETVNELV